MDELKHKAATSMVWTALQNYSMMFINFFADSILARLLTPYDFGCIGMLAIFMVLAETFIEFKRNVLLKMIILLFLSGIWVWHRSFI